MRIKIVVMIAGALLWVGAPVWATTLNYSFSNCSQITSSLGSHGTCPGDLETSHATYTSGAIGVTATGYANAATNLYVKDDGGDENGLGIAAESDHEIDPSQFIQLNLTNLADAGITSGTLSIGSVQAGEGYAIYTSDANGQLGHLELTGTLDDQGFTVTWSANDPLLAITAVVPGGTNWKDCQGDGHSDVLLTSLSANMPNPSTPEPQSLCLFGTGLLAVGFAVRKRTRPTQSR